MNFAVTIRDGARHLGRIAPQRHFNAAKRDRSLCGDRSLQNAVTAGRLCGFHALRGGRRTPRGEQDDYCQQTDEPSTAERPGHETDLFWLAVVTSAIAVAHRRVGVSRPI